MEEREKEEIGKITGAAAGFFTGARIGSLVVPIPFVGTFAGAVVGGVVGSEVGKRVGRAVIDGAEAFVETLRGDEDAVPAAVTVDGDVVDVVDAEIVEPEEV